MEQKVNVYYGKIIPKITYNSSRIPEKYKQISLKAKIVNYKDHQGININNTVFTLYSDNTEPVPLSTNITTGFYFISKAKFQRTIERRVTNVEHNMTKNISSLVKSFIRIYRTYEFWRKEKDT
jgi:hypothetical protein